MEDGIPVPLMDYEKTKLTTKLKKIRKDYLNCLCLKREEVYKLNPQDIVEIVYNSLDEDKTLSYHTKCCTVLGFDHPKSLIVMDAYGTRYFKFSKYKETWWVTKPLYSYNRDKKNV